MLKKIFPGIVVIVVLFACFFVSMRVLAADNKQFVLVIDAGHGGKDPGAVGKTAREKDINLSVALALGRLIESDCPDVRVIYTRKTDVFIPLQKRASMANKASADLFISIHTNALPAGKIGRGAETYTLGIARADENLEVAKRENSVILIEDNYKEQYQGFDPRSAESYIMFEFMQDRFMAQSVDFARMIQSQFRTTAGRNDKGVHQAGFLVLRETSMPSVLVELGYISTPDEERFLKSSEGVRVMSRSIYNAFLSYKKGYKKEAVAASAEHSVSAPVQDRSPDASVKQTAGSFPIFKIQILASSRQIPAGSERFKGLSPIECFQENDLYKYTYGSSADYNEIVRLRKKISNNFDGAFIVAFKNGIKMDLQQAISEYKKNN